MGGLKKTVPTDYGPVGTAFWSQGPFVRIMLE